MRVKDVMTPSPLTCRPDDHLGTAMGSMGQGDCGFVPVVVPGEPLVGVITGRDVSAHRTHTKAA